MKRILALILIFLLVFTSCSVPGDDLRPTVSTEVVTTTPDDFNQTEDGSSNINPPAGDEQPGNEQPDDTHTHNYTSTVTAPTCQKAGYTTYTCSGCGDTYVADETASLGHNYTESVTAPTCDEKGYTTFTCSECAYTYTSNELSAKGHSYKTSIVAPTCDKAGYTTYTCSVCAYSYVSNTAAATGHSWIAATTEAPKTCSVCGKTEGEKLPGASTGYGETLYVNYIDVGQGDSIYIKIGDCDILIDAGTASYGKTVSNYLKSQGVDDIELMVNTHPDSDHCGGLTQVLQDYVVEKVWISKYTNKTTAAYKNFVAAIKNEGLTAEQPNANTVYTYEQLTLTVIYSAIGSDCNNSSIVIMLAYGSTKFLFTGDAGEEVEKKLVSTNADLRCDVLKVGHHGSKYSSTASFLSATNAKYGVICVGADNTYGHPTSAALSRLSSAGISVYRTDQSGHIVFSTDGTTLTILK